VTILYFKDRLVAFNLTNKRLFCLTYPLKIKKKRKKTIYATIIKKKSLFIRLFRFYLELSTISRNDFSHDEMILFHFKDSD